MLTCEIAALVMQLGPLAVAAEPTRDPIVGLYVHQHWPYAHPYAARTWSLVDWRGYVGGFASLDTTPS